MQPDGSLVMCAFEAHGGCAKRDFCPFSHKYEPKPSISGLSGEEISSSLQITLAPGASDDASTTEQDDDETKENASEKETVEPPPKKLRPTEGAKKSSGIISLGSPTTKESKPQSVSFVKSFQEILKQKELEKDTAKTEEKTQTEKAPAATRDLTEKKKQETPVAADGKGRKRKNAEQASKKQETPKAAQQDRKKPDALSRISRPGSTPSPAPASTSPKAPPSFGIKSLGELMQQREQQPKPQQEQQAADRATSAVAKKQPEAKKQKTEASAASTPTKATAGSPSVGEKRKLDELKTTPSSTTTAAAKPAPTTAKATIDESFDDLEKELDELGVVLDGEEDVDVDIDLGLEGE